MKIIKINKLANKFAQEDYQTGHSAPAKEAGTSLDDPSDIFPEDIYSSHGARHYGDRLPSDYDCHAIICAARGRPNYRVTVYRAVPDINYDINKEIKKHKDIIQYHDKFGFFPINSDIVEEKQEEVKNMDITYDERQEAIYNQLIEEIERLEAQKEPSLKINPGDWVTLSLDYAKLHGQSNLGNRFKILQKKVLAKDLYTEGSMNEWGYNP
jgi:hypothetical protein